MKPTTPSNRAQTNRANASHSTGPKTAEGKQAASLNALRHGLTGRTVVLPGDDLELYRAFCQRFADDLQPSGVVEESLVQTIADSAWRLDRSAALEANLLSLGLAQNFGDTSVQLVRLSLYSQRISRTMHATLGQLREIQKERREREADALDNASDLRKFNLAHDIAWKSKQDGFELSLAKIDTHIDLQSRLSEASGYVLLRE